MRTLCQVLVCLGLFPSFLAAADPVKLGEDTYKADLGLIILQVNWGRTWRCGRYENAQLEALTFMKSPIDGPENISLDLETPSRLAVQNRFVPYAFVVQPGEYVLTAFDVKIARSRTDVVHIKGSKDKLVKDGKPVGGSFSVQPGEIVYIGHFGLDCGAEPFLWRYYIDGRNDFERYIAGFREAYPFVKQVPVHFRLFSTQTIGNPFALEDPTVK